MAVAALVLGIVGLLMFWSIWLGILLGVLAIVFGALGRSRAAQGAPNKGLAIAGLVLGIVAVASSLVFLGLLVSVFDDTNDLIDQVKYCVDHPQDPDCY